MASFNSSPDGYSLQPNQPGAPGQYPPFPTYQPDLGTPPQQDAYYNHDHAYNKEQGYPPPPVMVSPTSGYEQSVPVSDTVGMYSQVNITKWFSDSWIVYKQHWWVFILYYVVAFLILLGLDFIPRVGGLFVYLLYPPVCLGPQIAVLHKIRKNIDAEIKYVHFLYGFFYFLPLLGIYVLRGFAVSIGLILCIIPGIYIALATMFSSLVFVEFHDQQVNIIRAMTLSITIVNKHLIEVFVFAVCNFLLALAGFLAFGVGALITVPLSSISVVFAFHDLFGLNAQKSEHGTCVVC